MLPISTSTLAFRPPFSLMSLPFNVGLSPLLSNPYLTNNYVLSATSKSPLDLSFFHPTAVMVIQTLIPSLDYSKWPSNCLYWLQSLPYRSVAFILRIFYFFNMNGPTLPYLRTFNNYLSPV